MKGNFWYLPIIFLGLNFATAWAQTSGKIQGQVLFEKLGMPGVSVWVQELSQGSSSDSQGHFTLNQIPAGSYQLKISLIGFQSQVLPIEVSAGQTTSLTIDLLEDRLNLDEIVVSATRYERDRREAPVMVKVLGSKMFNATQSVALSEGLSFQPGVRVETNCQNCGFTQVRLNGLEGAYSQILINSRAVFSALNSVYGLDQIPTNIIERVEVVRSGGSALYGSNAIAGTINIVTREPVENLWQVSNNFALIDGRTPDNTLNFNGSLVNESLKAGLTLYGMNRNRDFYDANGDGFSEITRLRTQAIGTKAYLKPSPYAKLSLDLNYIHEYRRGGDRFELSPPLTDITEELDHNTVLAGITYEQSTANQKHQFSTYISGQYTHRDSFYGGFGGGRTPEDSLLAANAFGNTNDLALISGGQYSYYFSPDNVLIIGLEDRFSKVEDEIPGYNRLIDQQVNALGFFSQLEWKLGKKFKALIGGRFDYTRVDGFYNIGNIQRSVDVSTSVFSPRLTLLYDLSPSFQLRGGYARGFRAPQAFDEDLHISSVGGEPQFVILSENLDKELSDAYTFSLSYDKSIRNQQISLVLEGFYTRLKNPFTIVSTGSVLENGSILEEVRNGQSAYVSGSNFELNYSPSSNWTFQMGGTWQRSRYQEAQVLFEPETPNEEEPLVSNQRFLRNPNFYGYLTTSWQALSQLSVDLTGTFTGSMLVPRVVSESGFIQINESNPFLDINLKVAYDFELGKKVQLQLSSGVQNIFNSYQDDFDIGAGRDSDYIYGPARPRTFFFGLTIGNFLK
ncbi:MAG: TonB-dependent receptor [Bacteroidota bacterium]